MTDMHEVGAVLTFLSHVPERQRAEKELDRLVDAMRTAGLIADAQATGYVRKALAWAPTPDHPLRKYFPEEQIQSHLDALLAERQAAGGWTISWPPLSPGCELEWRGWVTLTTLRRLHANGRLVL